MWVTVVWLVPFVGPLAVEPVFVPNVQADYLEAIPYGGIPSSA